MRIFLLLLGTTGCVFRLAPSPVLDETAVAAYASKLSNVPARWKGDCTQYGLLAKRYPLTIVFADDRRSARIEYPSLGCGGMWALQDANGRIGHFRERIQGGLCLEGKAQFHLAKDVSLVEWRNMYGQLRVRCDMKPYR